MIGGFGTFIGIIVSGHMPQSSTRPQPSSNTPQLPASHVAGIHAPVSVSF
jgi:hypothetical protein